MPQARMWTGCLVLVVLGCAARADPVEVTGHVVEAGAGAPVRQGATCRVNLVPDWRQGVNCRVLLRCNGVDLFGGARVGGYAVCDTQDHAFLTAVDSNPRDGDPALDLDLRTRRIRWQDREPAAALEIALDGPARAP